MSKKDITTLLESLWEDESLYMKARSAFLKDFSFHTEEYCLAKFGEFVRD